MFNTARKVFVCILATIALYSCGDDGLDFERYRNRDNIFSFKDVPESVDLLVGEEQTLVIKAETKLDYSISAICDNYDVADVVEVNDTTLLVKGIREGSAVMTVSFSTFSVDVKVNVSDIALKSFSIDRSSVTVACGGTTGVRIIPDPANYPVRRFEVESDLQGNACTAIINPYSEDGNCLRIFGTDVGTGTVTVSAKDASGAVIRKSILVTSEAVAIEKMCFRSVTDSSQTDSGMQYIYKELADKVSMKTGGQTVMELFWTPENATICGMDVTVNYKSDGIEEKWDYSEGGKVLSAEDIQELIESGDIDGLRDLVGNTEPAEKANKCEVYRRYSGKAFFEWTVNGRRPATVTINARAKYYSNVRKDVKTMEKKITIEITR